MKLRLPRWVRGQRPKASELNQLAAAIERLAGLAVDGTYGLQLAETSAGWTLSLIPRPLFGFAVITTECPAYNATTKVDGKGAGTLDLVTYSSSGVSTHAATTPARSIVVYNGGLEVIPAGRRVAVYEERPGRWHAIVNYCPAT